MHIETHMLSVVRWPERHGTDSAASKGLWRRPAPCRIMLKHLQEAGERGWTDLDWTAVSRVIREPAGITEDE